MRKQLIIIVLIVGMLSVVYGFNGTFTTISIGDEAPTFIVKNDRHEFTTSNHNGRFTLVALWTSNDANSRAMATAYSRWFQTAGKQAVINYAAINLDQDKTIYNEIVRQDRLPQETQYYGGSALAQNISATYGLDGCYGAILIDPDGTIVAVNPDVAFLERLKAS